MTQIQALENLSQTDLVQLIQTERQQHADNMDMLSKELASRTLAAPEGYKIVPIVPTMEMVTAGDQRAIKTAWMIGGSDVVPAIYHAMLAAAPTAPGATQAQWIEHCNITDIPDAVLTPSGLAIKSEQADTQEPIAWVSEKGLLRLKQGMVTNPISKDKDGAIPIYASPHTSRLEAEVDLMVTMLEEREWAEHCGQTPLGQRLEAVITRLHGEIYRARQLVDKAPEMQAFQVDGTDKMQDSLVNKPFTACTCPSGDGSLRWPCPVHPPESVNLTQSSNQQVDLLSKDEWIKQCAKRFMVRTHIPKNTALDIAESLHSNMGEDYNPPKDAADEEMSNWTD